MKVACSKHSRRSRAMCGTILVVSRAWRNGSCSSPDIVRSYVGCSQNDGLLSVIYMILRHLIFRGSKRDPNFGNYPMSSFDFLFHSSPITADLSNEGCRPALASCATQNMRKFHQGTFWGVPPKKIRIFSEDPPAL